MILEVKRNEEVFLKRKGFKKKYRVFVNDFGDIDLLGL